MNSSNVTYIKVPESYLIKTINKAKAKHIQAWNTLNIKGKKVGAITGNI